MYDIYIYFNIRVFFIDVLAKEDRTVHWLILLAQKVATSFFIFNIFSI